MERNCDNCANQDPRKLLQDCDTFGYPLFENCQNWKPKNEQVKRGLELEEQARELGWR